MQEETHEEADTESASSQWLENKEHASSDQKNEPAEGMLVGIQEQPSADLYKELGELEEKVNALITRCEELQQVNESLAQQLTKESETRAALLEVQADARKRVDQLVQRLRDLEEEAK